MESHTGSGSDVSVYTIPWWPWVATIILAPIPAAFVCFLAARDGLSAFHTLSAEAAIARGEEIRFGIMVAVVGLAVLVWVVVIAYLLLLMRRYSVSIALEGISMQDWRGRTKHASWEEIMEARLTQNGVLARLLTREDSIRIHGYLSALDGKQLAEEVLRMVPLRKVNQPEGHGGYNIYRRE